MIVNAATIDISMEIGTMSAIGDMYGPVMPVIKNIGRKLTMTATVALFRALVKKGVLTRDEAVRVLLDEAVSRAIQAEAPHQGEAPSDVNRQCAEILKFIAEKL